ncbi:MAG: glutamate formimidoyltransferase, partial [Bacteroidota bacterium]|nr:glutamate formimidoyltransferase [Bacteroidota bacterium]
GEHPRFGATDVCPLVPIANIKMDEVVEYAHKLGERVGKELKIPAYFYEFAAKEEKRKNLATVRSGEYEGLAKKLSNTEWKPDFGPAEYTEKVKKTGVTAISARNFLVAYNFNLNTTSTRRANAIAFDVREAGRFKLDPKTKTKVLDKNGNPIRVPGTLLKTKAIGWYIEEYGIAQISMNLTDISVTSIHQAFDEVVKSATSRGIRITGSELVGLVPKQALIDAAKHYLTKQQRSLGISEEELIKIAVKSLGLDDLKPFIPEEKIIEYLLEDESTQPLINMTVKGFAEETASESPAPGGGSIAAYMGALGASLGTMVANLSSHKRGWDDRWAEYSVWAEKGQAYKDELLALVDEDTNAFNKIMDAFKLSKGNDEEKAIRKQAIQDATKYAIEIPFRVMKTCYDSMEVMEAMANTGLSASISDAGVGTLAARAGVMGAFLNVKINASGLDDKDFLDKLISEAEQIQKDAISKEQKILKIVNEKIAG